MQDLVMVIGPLPPSLFRDATVTCLLAQVPSHPMQNYVQHTVLCIMETNRQRLKRELFTLLGISSIHMYHAGQQTPNDPNKWGFKTPVLPPCNSNADDNDCIVVDYACCSSLFCPYCSFSASRSLSKRLMLEISRLRRGVR